jgi:hypothetical protein
MTDHWKAENGVEPEAGLRFSRRETMIAGSALAAGAVLAGCQSARPAAAASPQPRSGAGRAADDVIASWPPMPQQAARQMMGKYGPPAGVTPDMLVWRDTDPWKQTIVYREEVPHKFPMPHTDLLEQWVDYRVPVGAFTKLAEYDGSVIVERTKGTMSARCDKEEMNFLALNLAHDIITGRRSVEDARQFYAKTAKAFKAGQKDPYTQRLLFEARKGGTADPDKEMT